MMAPWYERAKLLYAAIDKASFALKRSIDRVVVVGNQIHFQAGTKKLAIAYRYVSREDKILGSASFLLDGEHYERPEIPNDRPPWFVRSVLLYAAIRQTTFELQTGVDGAEVTAGKVRCWAGVNQQTMRYRYAAEPGPFGPRRLFLDDEEIIN
jgi:hypothetical protein